MKQSTPHSIELQYPSERLKDWHFPTDSSIESQTTHTQPINKPNRNSEFGIKCNGQFDNEEVHEADTLVAEPNLSEPPLYAVIMYNDNYTPMDFVVLILMGEFKHSQDEAMKIMLNIHEKGKGVAGIYTKDIAETKAMKVNSTSQREGYPLMTHIEPSK